MPQNTNLNVSPYFDDFSDSNNYQRVLFKPGTPIQARELTTLQSILQNQVEKFGRHLFKEGAMIIPGQAVYDPQYTCVQIDESHLGLPVSLYIDNLINKTIQGETSGVKAIVENYITDVESDNGNYTLYIKYQSSGTVDFNTKTFVDGENLISLENVSYSLSTIRSGTTFATSIISNSIAVGSAAKIEEGIYFVNGFFVTVGRQTVILDQYTNRPSYRIGLLINEEIVTASDQYLDLFDNAQGFSNYAAPGADRLKISTTFIKKSIEDINDENFVELIRVENGIPLKFKDTTEYSFIRDEFARRTYDESGDYYVKPFDIDSKECLNDRTGNNGIYLEGQKTKQGNQVSKDLLCLSVSPGKAYIRGYEVETIDNVIIDIEKSRTTENDYNQAIPFNLGRQIILNNVTGSVPVGFDTDSHINLYNGRTVTAGISSGEQIGVSRVYDFKLKNSPHVNATTQYEISLYDIQTYTILTLNSSLSQTLPAFIKGKNSGASGYLVDAINESSTMKLYQVSGSFVKEETIEINENIERTIINIRDYNFSDVHQIVGNGVSFTGDPLLSYNISIAPSAATFTISSISGGISTITSSNQNFYTGIKIGDIVSYSKTGENVVTFNKVSAINTSGRSLSIESLPSVSGICSGNLPSSQITTNDLKKVTLEVLNTSEVSLYSKINKSNVANLDLTGSDITIRRSSTVTVSNGGCSLNSLLTSADLTFVPFDEEDYNLTFTDGSVEELSSQKVDISNKKLLNISKNGEARFTYTLNKINTKTKKKIFNRCSSLVVNKSTSTSSVNGLSHSQTYGLRVQDEEISLNVPDVSNIIAIIESSTDGDPSLPSLQLLNISSNLLNAVKGELIVGNDSGAVATLVSSVGANTVDMVYLNENLFTVNETVIFQESKIQASVSSLFPGDKNIKNNYIFDNGQRSEYLDFSRIIRKSDGIEPSKRIRIIYNHYTISSSDTGDFVGVNSYDKDRYERDIPFVDGIRLSDVLDCRPRISNYSGSFSPFDFRSRIFESSNGSSTDIFAKDKNINLSYDYYLPRIDRLFLDKDGVFIVKKGIPSLTPKLPNGLDTSLEIATLYLPAYVFDTSNVKISLSTHKRYRMKDISSLDKRLTNVEYYTSLSLLESDTQNLTIRDETTKLDRFKCGFFVDNFKSYNGGDIANSQYKSSVDANAGELKPQPYTVGIDLLLGSESYIGIGENSNPNADLRFVTDLGSNDIKRVGDVICLNYTEAVLVKNEYATTECNVNPFHVSTWIGGIELNPSSDTWIETRKTKRPLDVEGSYTSAMQQLNADTNTGLSPIDWGAWETTWSGVTDQSISDPIFTSQTGSTLVGQNSVQSGGFTNDGQFFGIPITTTNTFQNSFINFSNQTTTTTTNQSRQGIQYKVSPKSDSVNLGDRVVSREIVKFMRSRNIEIIAKRLLPFSQFTAFFDNVDVTKYITPKLLEVSMISGTFTNGETVTGVLGSKSIRFRLATQNHKYGPYISSENPYTLDPYDAKNIISSSYSSTTKILNVDTASLELQSESSFYGCIDIGMKLIGKSSGAEAKVSNLRLICDNLGVFIGSFFIPDSISPSAPQFTTGTKTFVLSTSKTNESFSGSTSQSKAESNFSSSGTLDNVEDVTLSIRNAEISRTAKTDVPRSSESTDIRLVSNISNNFTTTQNTVYVDPLAQSFEVTDNNGVFVTKCDVFFKNKSTSDLPVTLQIRTMRDGSPTQVILPFGEVVLDAKDVSVSDTGLIPTTFTFPSPVYLGRTEFALVLLTASTEYVVWISAMAGDGRKSIVVSTIGTNDEKTVSEQPLLGSFFKSQNGSTWDSSQYEDLKFTLYRANFVTTSASVRFYNPNLDVGNDQVVSLRSNPIQMYSKSSFIGIGTSISSADQSNLVSGVKITQTDNANFSSKLLKVLGGISTGTPGTLTITNPGTGYTNTSKLYSNTDLVSLSGFGRGAKVNLTINGGVAVAATVSVGGTGYAKGDILTISPENTDNLGKNLILSIPNSSGIITSVNSLIVNNIQGQLISNDPTKTLKYGSNNVISNSNITSVSEITDGLRFKVNHNNHGMYSSQNKVILSGIESDLTPLSLSASYSKTLSGNNPISFTSSVGILTTFENIPVGAGNTGYILIKDEIVGYTSVDVATNTITGIVRGTIPESYDANQLVFKYEMNGVSLKRINKVHTISNDYNIDLDEYSIKLDQTTEGLNRSTANNATHPELFFNETKSGGTYEAFSPVVGSIRGPKASQNIQFNIVRPIVGTLLPQSTEISAKIRTFSGTSADGNEISFVDQGFEDISLISDNILTSPRIIASEINEKAKLLNYPGAKSFTLEMVLSTKDTKVSPMIDLDRVNITTTMARLNKPISNYSKDPRVNSSIRDPHAAIYISKIIKLKQSADSIKVLFDAYRDASSDIRVLYRIFRDDTLSNQQIFELFPGYKNLDNNGKVINPKDNDGLSDTFVLPSLGFNDFGNYEFTANDVPLFNGLQIKILMSGTNQALYPKIKDLRVIATKS